MALPTTGTMAVDWEQRIHFERLRTPPYDARPDPGGLYRGDLSVEEICPGALTRLVARVLDMVQRAEYKRRQAPPGCA